MFGMTGAGKSALGNLIAGAPVFDSGAERAELHHVLIYGPSAALTR